MAVARKAPSLPPDPNRIIAAGEVSAYTVCPMAWKLKWVDRQGTKSRSEESRLGMQLHQVWSEDCSTTYSLSAMVRFGAALLCGAVVVFLLARQGIPKAGLSDPAFQSQFTQLLVVLCLCGIGLWLTARALTEHRRRTGFASKQRVVRVEGDEGIAVRDYVSDSQRLAGKPDALVYEQGALIPIERKPLAKKVRDRYVAQILVYMRLLEELEGGRPPYGYLIIGSSCRRVKIDNSPERQKWLESIITEMRQVLATGTARPAPHPKKCRNCDVKHLCPASAAPVHLHRESDSD